MANLNFVNGRWINVEKPGGAVFFVGGGTVAYKGKGASDTNTGSTPGQPLSTISQGVTQCVNGRGDTVVILPGTITITSSTALDKTDMTLAGFKSQGNINASTITGTLGSTGDILSHQAANVVIEDLQFNASGAANTSRIDVGAAGLTVRNCTFQCGANDLETITVAAAGDNLLVDNCRFQITANGPDAAIEIEAAGVDGLAVRNCTFHGGNNTYQWDVGAINSGVAHTDCLIDNNVSTFGPAIIFSAAALGMISRNIMGEGTLGSMLDPGSCMAAENYEADAIDQSGRLFPGTVAS